MIKELVLPRANQAQGEMQLPGSKSISNRVLLMAALAKGVSTISGVLDSDDTKVMLNALQLLGVTIEKLGQDTYRIHGIEAQNSGFPQKKAEIFLGNAGTAFRPLTATLAVLGGDYYLYGVPRMHERPIRDLVSALKNIHCQVDYDQTEGYPPLRISPRELVLDEVLEVEGSVSSQYLTALLMVAPLIAHRLQQAVTIKVKGTLISKPYIAITLNLMKVFGVDVEQKGWESFVISPDAAYQACENLPVEGDASSASYFMALGAIGGGPVRIKGVGRYSIQGDIAFAEVLKKMGADIEMGDHYIEVRGAKRPLKSFDLDFNLIPDAAMTAAVLALYADGPCRLRNIASWRVKETDRILAMHTELEKLGAKVESGEDYLCVTPPETWKTARIHTYDDHRMAMCFSLATFGPVGVSILDPDCVAKTFPHYFAIYQELVQ